MIYAAQRGDGSWTGAVYDEVSPRIEAHHARFGETLLPVLSLTRAGATWQAELPSIEDERATWVVSRFQARQSLLNADLLDTADALIRATGNALVIGAWDDAQVFSRLSPSIVAMASALGLTDLMVDDLFRAAMQIEA